MIVLGIETTCDETAAAVVERDESGSGQIKSNIIYSQVKEHEAFGGVVPEIAARAHVETLDGIIKTAMDEAEVSFSELDGIAAAAGPGLIGGVIVGLTTAKTIALVHNKPLIALNHLEGHALTARLTHNVEFPYLLLLVSGGHTQLIRVEDVGEYRRLGTTIDDALGEAFDKTAKLLGLGFPGGPAVEKAAKNGDPTRFKLPTPLKGRSELNFSFAGLKTAVRQAAEKITPLGDQDIYDICASFQNAVVDTLCERLQKAISQTKETQTTNFPIVVAGGVAANLAIRSALEKLADNHGLSLIAPPVHLCTDNGAVIAWAGLERLSNGLSDPLTVIPRARWPLDPAAEKAPFAGVKA